MRNVNNVTASITRSAFMVILSVLLAPGALAQKDSKAPTNSTDKKVLNGQHDFDFEIGT
ncbi:MAG TPA: hypothetical protein VFQ50_08035 [Flavobacterium sp.]|nr:hypothetical protein [Flavobacterium sp.]